MVGRQSGHGCADELGLSPLATWQVPHSYLLFSVDDANLHTLRLIVVAVETLRFLISLPNLGLLNDVMYG